jgi:hypothetical protein
MVSTRRVGSGGPSVPGEERDMAEDELPDFSGKVVLFYVASPPAGLANGVIMEQAEFRRFGGKLLVIGRTPDKTDPMWASHLQSGVAWDSMVHYLVFDSRAEYERRMSDATPGLAKRLGR